jgi:2-phosphoglycerate kinase
VNAGEKPPRRPPPTVVVRSDYGLPYSKGVMAQSLMATGLPSERSFALAQLIEERLAGRGTREIGVDELRAVAEEVVEAQESEQVLTRFRQWWNVRNLDRPLLVLLGGVTGVGKSTVATQLAGRLGISHVIATDHVRQVVRAFFSHEFLPSVHHSSFDVSRALSALPDDASGTVAGFLRQAHDIAPGLDAVVERAVADRTPMVVEGVHLLPHIPSPHLREQATTVRALIAVRDEEQHRRRFHTRGMQTLRTPERYLEALDRIRTVQAYLVEQAEAAGIPVIESGGAEATLRRVLEVVLDAVGPGPAPGVDAARGAKLSELRGSGSRKGAAR